MLKTSRRKAATSILAASLLLLPIARGQAQSTNDAWSAISSDPRFSDAVALFEYAGLQQYVQTDKFTAFIPTNAAFDKNPDVLPNLMKGHSRAFPDTGDAVEFIRSHAITDLHPLSEFAGRTQTLTAMSGNPLHIDGTKPGVFTITWVSIESRIATANVVDKPIITDNGLIYPVDTVVLTTH